MLSLGGHGVEEQAFLVLGALAAAVIQTLGKRSVSLEMRGGLEDAPILLYSRSPSTRGVRASARPWAAELLRSAREGSQTRRELLSAELRTRPARLRAHRAAVPNRCQAPRHPAWPAAGRRGRGRAREELGQLAMCCFKVINGKVSPGQNLGSLSETER